MKDRLDEKSSSAPLIIGGGIVGQLCALALARRSAAIGSPQVTLLAPTSADKIADRPLVLLAPALAFLKTELPDVWLALVRNGAFVATHSEICDWRFNFKEKLANLKDGDLQFLCCRSSFFHGILSEFVAAEKNLDLVRARVTAFITCDQDVIGVKTDHGNFSASYVVDASGFGSQRTAWLNQAGLAVDDNRKIGAEYCTFLRFFEHAPNSRSSSTPLSFELVSKNKMRGGLYPQEGRIFALSFSLPKDLVDSKNLETQFTSFISEVPQASAVLAESRPVSQLELFYGLSNQNSNFYGTGTTPPIQGLFPIGDALLSSNPVYGRGITLACLQIEILCAFADEHRRSSPTLMHKKLKLAYSFWRQGALADSADSPVMSFGKIFAMMARRYHSYILAPLLKNDPRFYNDFLRHYQMRIPAHSLFSPRQHFRALKLAFFALTRRYCQT